MFRSRTKRGLDGALGSEVDTGAASVLTADRFCLHADAGLCADFDGPNLGEWADAGSQTAPTSVARRRRAPSR